jgi:hypothetical protein
MIGEFAFLQQQKILRHRFLLGRRMICFYFYVVPVPRKKPESNLFPESIYNVFGQIFIIQLWKKCNPNTTLNIILTIGMYVIELI